MKEYTGKGAAKSEADFAITSSLAVTSVTFCGRETLASSCHSDASFDVMTPPGACVLIQRKPTLFHRFRGVPGGESPSNVVLCIKYSGILLFWLKSLYVVISSHRRFTITFAENFLCRSYYF